MATHGAFYWNELNTHHVEAAKQFYGTTLGWTFDAMQMPTGTYWIAKAGDTVVGGIFTMSDPMFDGVPEHWFAYIAVDDVDARVKKAIEAGGALGRDPFDVPGVGRIAIVRDANGAMIGWMTPVDR